MAHDDHFRTIEVVVAWAVGAVEDILMGVVDEVVIGEVATLMAGNIMTTPETTIGDKEAGVVVTLGKAATSLEMHDLML